MNTNSFKTKCLHSDWDSESNGFITLINYRKRALKQKKPCRSRSTLWKTNSKARTPTWTTSERKRSSKKPLSKKLRSNQLLRATTKFLKWKMSRKTIQITARSASTRADGANTERQEKTIRLPKLQSSPLPRALDGESHMTPWAQDMLVSESWLELSKTVDIFEHR